MWQALRMQRTIRLAGTLLLAALPALPVAAATLPDGLYAEFTTPRGVIVCRLEYRKAPMTVSNFVGLAEGTLRANGAAGKRFYDGLAFHRVEPGFVIQGGDPKGNGSGGPGYQFPNEVSADLKHDGPGVLAMANSGPNTNGCQFYITMKATPQLDGGYSVFGRVVQGQDVVTKIAKGDRMTTVKILRIGADAQAFTVTQAGFDAMVASAKAAVAEKSRRDREAALAEIAKKHPGLKATASGLQYKVLKQGSGANPADGASVTVHYTGWLLDGTKFDSSKDRSGPATFRIGEVIEGWNEALKSMQKGETRLLVIPPELGYGERGYPGVIPGNAFLVFEVELISF
jgi:peptidyl-prolyl cis-trans isomerase A (cyclophilin A)